MFNSDSFPIQIRLNSNAIQSNSIAFGFDTTHSSTWVLMFVTVSVSIYSFLIHFTLWDSNSICIRSVLFVQFQFIHFLDKFQFN